MNTRQAKISMLTAKEVKEDKTLRTKGDKDRRLREKKQNNTKKFMEERKTLQVGVGRNDYEPLMGRKRAGQIFRNRSHSFSPNFFQIKHSKEKDKLAAKHEKQKQDLIKEVNDVSERVAVFPSFYFVLFGLYRVLDVFHSFSK